MDHSKGTKSQQTKRRIMDGYLDTMREKSWEKITVRELCTRLNISRATFYQYYLDSYDLLEQVEEPLLQELLRGYQQLAGLERRYASVASFEERYDLSCPQQFTYWFEFCGRHEKEMGALLGPFGEPHFAAKLRIILREQVAALMEREGMPDDPTRGYFLEALVELHIQGAQNWLAIEPGRRPDIQLLLNPINMIRIGGCYAHYQAFKQLERRREA